MKLGRWVLSHFLSIWVLLVLLIVALTALALNKLELKDSLVVLFSGIQFMLMYVLVLVTWWYARETAKISEISKEASKSSASQAEASMRMVEIMKQQTIYASQPVLWPSISWNEQGKCFYIDLANIGNGPALDIDIFVGRGKEPAIADSEHQWLSYIVQGHGHLSLFFRQPPLKQFDPHELLGEYTVFVEWRDLNLTGPFFQAKLSASLVFMDALSLLSFERQQVNIARVVAKRRVPT